MSGFLKNFQPNSLTFWIGFLTGALTWWFVGRLHILLPKVRQSLAERIRRARQELLSSTEARLRADVLRLAQRQHLAATLFALDEVLVMPRLIAPSMIYSGTGSVTEGEIHKLVLPYLPDRPELSARFHAQTLTLQQALEGGANLLLIGQPGSGKTVTLATLATWAARQSENLGSLRNHLPLYVQISDLGLAHGIPLDLLSPIQAGVSEYASTLTLARLPAALRIAFESGKVLLLVDGLDEATPEAIERASEYLAALQIKYPQARIVVAASCEYFDGLVNSGLAPVSLAAWDQLQREQFIQHWGELWDRFIRRTGSEESYQPVDTLMLTGWLLRSDHTNTPLELTLKVWAAYAGDATGPNPADSIQAYIKRASAGIPDGYQALQKIAVQMITQGLPTATVKEVEIWIADLLKARALAAGDAQVVERLSAILETPAEELVNPEPLASPAQAVPSEPESKGFVSRLHTKKAPQTATARLLPDLASSGLLSARKDGRLGFTHIVVAGYLAAGGLSEEKLVDCLNDMPGWEGKFITMRFLTASEDLSPQINPMLEGKRDPLLHGLFLAGSWLADASKLIPWRGTALKKLAAVMQNETYSLGVRARALCVLAGTRDPGAGLLFRQLLSNNSDQVRLLAALGCGLARDPKTVDELIQLIQDPCLEVGQAAILALAAIHTQPALEAVARTILEGNEELRRTAAEVLAYDPEEGHPVLTEGSQMEDLLVRRAVVYGLARVGQPWAEELLVKIQIEDGQWVVRSAATQALEEVRRPNPHAPRPLPPPTEIPWIIEVAGKLGMGVTPDKPVTDMVVQALKTGDPVHCRAALDYLVQRPEPATVPQIYQILYGPEGELREAAFNTLWHMYAAGMDLPAPKQFGLG